MKRTSALSLKCERPSVRHRPAPTTAKTGIRWTRRRGKVTGDAPRVRSGGGAPSLAPDDGERRDVLTLRTVRTSASYPVYIYRPDQRLTSTLPLKCERLSVLHRLAPTTAFLLPHDSIGIPDDFTMKMKAMEIRFEGLGNNIHPKL
ncbi:hypothetical protein ACLB2K_006155 [Fragaria x ananassa]